MAQPIEADSSDPRQLDIEDVIREPASADVARENLARIEQAEVHEWHHALEALRRINAMPNSAALFLDHHGGFDHAIRDELRQTRAWINDILAMGQAA